MSVGKSHHRYRPAFSVWKRRQLLVVAGALFVWSLWPAPTAHAKGVFFDFSLSRMPILEFISPLKDRAEKLKVVEKNLDIHSEKLEQQVETVTAAANQAGVVEQEKQALAAEVKQLQAAVAVKQAQVEAKRAEEARLLAARSVNIVNYALDAAGNAYAPGNCTWYVKQKRPDIGNFWGDANAWYGSAQRDGFRVGQSPKVGAIAVSFEGYYGHVAYVEEFDGNSVTISEMNYGGLYVTNTRTVSAGSFVYIYEKM